MLLSALASGPSVRTTTLPSGLTVWVDDGGLAPVVSVQLWVRAGSAFEARDESGAAHLLEHLVFKGAAELKGSAWIEAVEAVGGELNAWTSFDQTCFYVTAPVAGLRVAMRTVGALALKPWLKASDLIPERGVVIEEIRGAEDDPSSVLSDRVRAAMWGDHPCARPVLGTAETVQSLSAEHLRAFHARQYAPDRLGLVVCGPVDDAEVARGLDEIEGWALELSRQAAALPEHTVLPPAPQRPARPGCVLVQEGHVDRVVEVVFPTPGPAHEDAAALDVLVVLLGDGAAARLQHRLRDELGVALSSWAYLETESVGGMAVLGATSHPNQEAAVVRAMAEEVEALRQAPPTERELLRARALVRSDTLRERETAAGQANRLGWYLDRFGSPGAEQAYDAALDAVTPACVQRVAKRWLVLEDAVVGVASGGDSCTEAGLWEAWLAGGAPRALPAVATRSLSVHQLPCGLRVTVDPQPTASLVGLSVIGLGGLTAEPRARAGVAAAWSRLLTRGAGALNARQLADLTERRSGSMGAWASRSSVGLDLAWPSDELAWAVWLLTEMLSVPTFSDEETARVVSELMVDRELSADDPTSLAWERTWSRLFGRHSWGRPTTGTVSGLGRVDAAAVRRYHRSVMQSANLCVAVSGPVDADEVVALLSSLDRALAGGPARHPSPPLMLRPRPGRQRVRVSREEATAQVVVGWTAPTLGVGSADEGALRVLEGALSGCVGGGGRLFEKVREELGLAYDVGASWEGGLGGGAWLMHAGTDPDRVGELVDALFGVAQGLAEPWAPGELDRVRRGLVDGAVLGRQRSLARARTLAAAAAYRGDARGWLEAEQLPLAVTESQARDLAQRLFHPDDAVVCVAGPKGMAW